MVFISISGVKLVKKILKIYKYKHFHTRGSHQYLKIKDKTPITVPAHKELKEGTLNGILKNIGEDLNKTKIQVFNELFKK